MSRFRMCATTHPGAITAAMSRYVGTHTVRVRRTDRLDASMYRVELGSSVLLGLTYGTEVTISAPTPLRAYAMLVPQIGTLHVETPSGTVEAGVSDAVVLNAGEPVRMHTTGDYWNLTVLFDSASIQRQLSLLGIARPRAHLHFQPSLTAVTRTALAGQLAVLERTLGASSAAGVAPMIGRQLEAAMINTLLLTQPHAHTSDIHGSGPAVARQAILDAAASLRAAPARRYSIAEIAERCGISPRALHLGFRTEFGMTPMSYLREVRLDLAREHIAASSPDCAVSVLELAHSVGYGHAGRFAADFTRKFGLSPSAAIRSTRARRQIRCSPGTTVQDPA